MTPAVNYLKAQKVTFELLRYEHDPQSTAFGLEAAQQLDLPVTQVFKTLVLMLNNETLLTALVPTSSMLDMKAVAQQMNVKSAKMASPDLVKNSTGYVLGGVSPFGQKKTLPTICDVSANEFEIIYVSAGKRGLELAISPNALSLCLCASFAQISKQK
ncbi:Cys-tRNA(Pro) deacylase [Glaciecola sp. SC05]|uniref:Cys-tRNA(Pro) deacylase n=1 Tax=Glaciecola sp. SC05 TaxID=1987355 RepID=UPI003526F41D